MASFKWKKIPVYDNPEAKEEFRKLIKYDRVNRLSNYQIMRYPELKIYKSNYPEQVKQMLEIAKERKLI